MKFHTRSLGIALCLTLCQTANAGEIYEFYNGVRALGMGGAYVATVNDETALYTNPAALGKLRDPFITLIDPEMGFSSKITSHVKTDTLDNLFSAQGMVDLIKDDPGKHLNFRFQLSPGIVLPNFGFGVLAKWEANVETNEAGNQVSIDYRNDYSLGLGYNFRLFDGILKIGVAGLLTDRIEVDDDVPTTITDLTYESIASEGMGLKVNVGMLLTAPVAYLPSLGVVVRDVGHTSYTLSDGLMYTTTERPRSDLQKVDVGASISPIFSNRTRATVTVEARDVMTKDAEEKKDIMRRFHAGAELNLADVFFLRGGWHQKYWTAGFEFASQRFQLQAAYYGEDIGTPKNPKEDRRLVGKFALRF